jgi:hypothetical protein
MPSATTNFKKPLVEGDVAKTIQASQAFAAERLQGSDGLVCVSSNLLDDGELSMTWRREWEEKPVAK